EDLSRKVHEAFYVARSGRPGPVLIDLPKDVQQAKYEYVNHAGQRHRTYNPARKPERSQVEKAVELMASAKRPLFYIGGGCINSGPLACKMLVDFVRL